VVMAAVIASVVTPLACSTCPWPRQSRQVR
jgi:hypothetical protein